MEADLYPKGAIDDKWAGAPPPPLLAKAVTAICKEMPYRAYGTILIVSTNGLAQITEPTSVSGVLLHRLRQRSARQKEPQ